MGTLGLANRLAKLPADAYCGGAPSEAVDATAAIKFAVTIHDNIDRLDFLNMWLEGDWRGIKKWPGWATGKESE